MKNWFKKNYHYFIPMLITLVICLFAFLVRGVIPFSNKGFPIIDYIIGLVPSYTYLWDFIHGKANFLFNANLGLGSNMYASSVLNTFFSPLSYLVGLSSREGIKNFVLFIIVIKMMLMATTSYIVFKKWFKQVDNKMVCLLSLVWTFSSWLLVHVSNVGWLDVMIIFPFLIDSLKDLMEKGKMKRFIFLLALCLIFSYYMAYMILIMMIVGGFVCYFVLVDKDKRKKFVGQIFVGTLTALFLSMFAFLPSFLQSQASYRFNGGELDYQNSALYTKASMLLFYGILLYLPFKLFTNKKTKEDKYSKFLLIFLFLTILPVLVEPINKMWHTGSYFSYPFRYSFIPIFFLIIASLYYLDKYQKEELEIEVKKNKYDEVLFYISSLLFLVISIVLPITDYYIKIHLAFLWSFSESLFIFLCIFASSIFAIIMAVKRFGKKFTNVILLVVTGIQIVTYMVGFTGYNNGESVEKIYEYKNAYDFDKLDNNYGIKDTTNTLMANFPLLLEHRSMSTWLHINGQDANINARSLGYKTATTSIYSYGGTIFSDLLANNRYILSDKELDSDIYNLIETKDLELTGKTYLYEYKYNLPLSMIFDSDFEIDDFKVVDPFSNQNTLYKKLFNKETDLIRLRVNDNYVDKTKIYEIDVTNKELLYLYSDDELFEDVVIKVNDKEIEVDHGNAIVDLGSYQNQKVKIEVTSEEIFKNLEIASIDFEEIKNLVLDNSNNDTKISYKGNKVTIKVNSLKKGKLYVPINYEIDSWSAMVNNKEAKVEKFLQTYLAIEINEGENEIVLTFTPRMLKPAIIISVSTLLLAIIFIILDKKFKFFDKKGIQIVTFILGSVVAIAIGAYVYIIPLTK